MNAPERLPASNALATLSICYAPLIDKTRKAIGTRLTMLSTRPQERQPIGQVLAGVDTSWPDADVLILLSPLDAIYDDSLLDWTPPANAVVEVPTALLPDPDVQRLVQKAARDGKRMALRGRPEVPLPPALLSCFEYCVLHVSEDRRIAADGTVIPAPPGVIRRLPYVLTGVQTIADLDGAYNRGAAASVGWPIDDAVNRAARPLQPGQAVVLELLRLVRDDAEIARIDATLKRDPALAFKLLRLVNSAAFGLSVQITSFQHAVMMLGYKKMMRWLSVLLATASKEANTFPLMHASIRRGLFLEYIGGMEANPETRDELFITGAFSLLDRITGARFEQLFELISLSETVTEAIVHRSGPYAPYLDLIESIERSDPIGVRKHVDTLALTIYDTNQALLRALAAASTLDREGGG